MIVSTSVFAAYTPHPISHSFASSPSRLSSSKPLINTSFVPTSLYTTRQPHTQSSQVLHTRTQLNRTSRLVQSSELNFHQN